jgi:hypothetical protein
MMIEFCFDCEMVSEKFREVSGNKYCEECWFERFYTMENVTCSQCELEDIEGGELNIYETEEHGWICADCRYDNRISYYDIEKAKEQMSKLYKELGIRGE